MAHYGASARIPWYTTLRGIREAAGLTQAEFAAHVGVHPSTISRIENGQPVSQAVLDAYGLLEKKA